MRAPLGLVLAVTVSQSVAQADSLVQTLTFGSPSLAETLAFNRFNGDPADIVSIQVVLRVGGALWEFDNDADEPIEVIAGFTDSVSISSVDVTLLDSLFQPVTGTASAFNDWVAFSLGPNDGDMVGSFQSGGTDYFGFMGLPTGDASGFVNSLFFFQYAGTGTFDVVVGKSYEGSAYSIEGDYQVVSTGINIQSGSVSIIYQIVPAPTAAALFGPAGFVGMHRRRRFGLSR